MTMENITKEMVLQDLENAPITVTMEDEYLLKTTLPKEVAEIVFAAYIKGVDRFFNDYYNANKERMEAEEKFRKLAVKMAEKEIA